MRGTLDSKKPCAGIIVTAAGFLLAVIEFLAFDYLGNGGNVPRLSALGGEFTLRLFAHLFLFDESRHIKHILSCSLPVLIIAETIRNVKEGQEYFDGSGKQMY